MAHPESGLAELIGYARDHNIGFNPTELRALGFHRWDATLDQMDAELGFRAAAPSLLPTRSEVVVDGAVISVGTNRLQFVGEMISQGLTLPLPNAMGIPYLENWMDSLVNGIVRGMNPEMRAEDQQPLMLAGRLPIYITKGQFSFGARELAQSRRVGLPLDTRMIKQVTRGINEAVEDSALNGATTIDGQALTVGGYSAPGVLNAPNANLATLTAAAWSTVPVGTTVMSEINGMASQLIGDFKRGPWTLFVPTVVDQAFNLDFKANGNDSIRMRISQMNAGGRPLKIVLVDTLPATKVVLAQMTDDVMQLVDGIRPTVIPYTSATGFTFHNIVLAIMVPRFFTDYNGNSGIVIGTLT